MSFILSLPIVTMTPPFRVVMGSIVIVFYYSFGYHILTALFERVELL